MCVCEALEKNWFVFVMCQVSLLRDSKRRSVDICLNCIMPRWYLRYLNTAGYVTSCNYYAFTLVRYPTT